MEIKNVILYFFNGKMTNTIVTHVMLEPLVPRLR
jgi:hypothetical protein